MAATWSGRAARGAIVLAIALAPACDRGGEGKSKPAQPDGSQAPYAASARSELNAQGKFDPPLTMSIVRKTINGTKYPAGESISRNIWTDTYRDMLGIALSNKWSIDETQYQQKMNVSIVSADLPDLFMVNSQQFQSLINGGQIADLTDAFNRYATELTKKSLAGGILRQGASTHGRLMGIPVSGGSYDNAAMIWIRTDWLARLHLAPPKTMDDVIAIAKAFTELDPDGNGKKDTYGMNLSKNLFDGYAGLEGFFSGYHAYPYNPSNGSGAQTMWLKDGSGKLVYGGIQPEVRTALGKLQEMYAAGTINPEFAVQDGTKASELEVAGKIGMHFGANWNANWPLINTQMTDSNADWSLFPLVSADSKPALPIIANVAPSDFYVVNKKFANPEAVILMLNLYMDKIYGPNADERYHIATEGTDNFNIFSYAAIRGGLPENNQDAQEAVAAALRAHDPSKLNLEQTGYYTNILKYRDGDKSQWWVNKVFGETGSYSILGEYKKSDRFMVNAFFGPPTPTIIERGSTLRDLETVMMTKVIMGEPIDLFDKFVKDWRSQGGDQITKEVNEWVDGMK
ncbi:type 2 periplasmic-binding domain-containing protein [Paenibacillus cymbidii]|uniref:extracellular solute-binding protein n=1 Tax=Paenibacillus cymbidii TaxID=1639034 RepID=UPI0010815BED|nr:extracellular solute-binding protein [Paenibacillus cymbidii]